MEAITIFFSTLFDPSMPPHGHCYLWNDDLVFLHVASDAVISLSYLSIPIALIYLTYKRKDLAFSQVVLLFGVFILACSATHAMSIYNVWNGAYWLSGAIKAITALASLATAIIVWPLIPKALAIPSTEELITLNDNLAVEITEKEQAMVTAEESQLIAEKSQELAAKSEKESNAANQAKSTFLANMSHEIRTPMNAVIGMTHLMQQSELTSKQQNYLEKIDRSAKSLLNIIDDILDFSKVEAGELEMENIPFQLEDVLANVANIIGVKAQQKGLEFLLRFAPQTPTLLIGDPSRLSQILINLAGNATKFTEQGEIEISVKALPDKKPQTDNVESTLNKKVSRDLVKIEFELRDTGIGMSQSQQEDLFKPFIQADSSTTREYGGTGLGLAICKQLVQLMGGEITFRSQANEGSIFVFSAWFELDPSITTSPGISGRKKSENLKIDTIEHLKDLPVLVVDDNEAARQILSEILASFGCKVMTANSGEQALGIVESASKNGNPFKLLILDYKMPGMNGLQVAKQIRADKGIPKSTNIVMISALQQSEIFGDDGKAVVDGFICKPATPSTLHDTIMAGMGYVTHEYVDSALKQLSRSEAVAKLYGARILLVEDNEFNQEVAQDLLENAHMLVDIAVNGKEALKMLDKTAYDGVLMDIQMPIMDGYEATGALRQDNRFQNLPVIAMTANAMLGDQEKCLAAGMNAYISKPIKVMEMFATMAQWISVKQGSLEPNSQLASSLLKNNERQGEESPGNTIAIPDISGINIKAGLDRLEGDRSHFLKLLSLFYYNHKNFVATFREALTSHDDQSATRTAHTLKSVAGTIGLEFIEQAAKELEQLCTQKQECTQKQDQAITDEVTVSKDLVKKAIEEKLTHIESALRPVISELESFIKKEAKPSIVTVEYDPTELISQFQHLKQLLTEGSTDARIVFDNIAQKLSNNDLSQPDLEKLNSLIGAYDYDGANTTLDKLLAQLYIHLE